MDKDKLWNLEVDNDMLKMKLYYAQEENKLLKEENDAFREKIKEIMDKKISELETSESDFLKFYYTNMH